MNRILRLQFYLVSSSSAGSWPGALPLQLRDPNYGNGDTNTFSKMMFEQFTEYLTGWQICQLHLSSEGSKLFSFRGALPLWSGAPPPDPATTPPPTANPLASPLIAESNVWSRRIAQRFVETKRKKWLHFLADLGLSPNLGLSESLSERLIQKVKWLTVSQKNRISQSNVTEYCRWGENRCRVYIAQGNKENQQDPKGRSCF